MKITVIAGGGIGGTEKAAYLFATELSRRGHQVTALSGADNCRAEFLTSAGVSVTDVPYKRESLAKYLRESGCEVVHQHTSGYADHRALYGALDDLGTARPKLIETNVFGRLMDRHDRGHVQMRMFVSMASGCQAFERPQIHRNIPHPDCHTVLYNPMPPSNPRPLSPDMRKNLGLGESDIVLVRVGRPSHKWAPWECEAFKIARESNPALRLVLIEPPSDLKAAIEAGTYGPGILVLPATSDSDFLEDLYRASDVMLHASRFGESYGYTLAEGMECGLPVDTRTTPWADNAQVQLVVQGKTGFVCCSVPGMADAVLKLAADRQLRQSMASAGLEHFKSVSDLSRETDLLEDILRFVVSGNRGEHMRNRYDAWREYCTRHFHPAEWDVDERQTGRTREYLSGKLHAFYRRKRGAVGSVYWGLRSRMGK